ncbi:hypothetical protein [Pseudalkalibacillus sp. SCS-8]|uniref:hypothetical protein n=1 Tax=Pseudalkalibacillus nanhaiensis TaxID=3115291 RepID=UPI0032DB8FC0
MLEQLFEFLFANLFFLIVVIGGILSFFKRQIDKYNEQQNAPRKGQQRQPVRPRPQAETISMPQEPREEKVRPDRPRQERQERVKESLQELYEEKRKELQNGVNQESNNSSPVVRPRSRTKTKERQISPNQVLPNPDHVAQGVIWAEILGPPRSKKPHHLGSRFQRGKY